MNFCYFKPKLHCFSLTYFDLKTFCFFSHLFQFVLILLLTLSSFKIDIRYLAQCRQVAHIAPFKSLLGHIVFRLEPKTAKVCSVTPACLCTAIMRVSPVLSVFWSTELFIVPYMHPLFHTGIPPHCFCPVSVVCVPLSLPACHHLLFKNPIQLSDNLGGSHFILPNHLF